MFDQATMEQITNQLAEVVRRMAPAGGVTQRYMSFAQAGEYMGVTEESVRYYVNQRWLPVSAKSAKRWIDKEDIDRFMSSNKDYARTPSKRIY